MVAEDVDYTEETGSDGTARPGRSRFRQMRQPAGEALELLAFRVGAAPWPALVPAPPTRRWIEHTDERFARRCLPLMLACQAGWLLINPHTVRVTWDGDNSDAALHLEFLSGQPPYLAVSHFGHGILTFHIPYLFRTPPGWNLLARGPANWPQDGALALEGLIETDWAVATFTMNWKLTTTDRPVTFEAGEPFCMLVPQRRGELERFQPRVRDLEADPQVGRGYAAWNESRTRFLVESRSDDPDAEARREGWQKHYFRGTAPDGTVAPAHQTKLALREVDDPAGWSPRHDRKLGS